MPPCERDTMLALAGDETPPTAKTAATEARARQHKSMILLMSILFSFMKNTILGNPLPLRASSGWRFVS